MMYVERDPFVPVSFLCDFNWRIVQHVEFSKEKAPNPIHTHIHISFINLTSSFSVSWLPFFLSYALQSFNLIPLTASDFDPPLTHQPERSHQPDWPHLWPTSPVSPATGHLAAATSIRRRKRYKMSRFKEVLSIKRHFKVKSQQALKTTKNEDPSSVHLLLGSSQLRWGWLRWKWLLLLYIWNWKGDHCNEGPVSAKLQQWRRSLL